MDELTKKFNSSLEELKSIFTVAQAMAKNDFFATLDKLPDELPTEKTIDINQIHQLGAMLTATTGNDTKRLVAIINTLKSFVED